MNVKTDYTVCRKEGKNMKCVVSIWQSVDVCYKSIALSNVHLESGTIIARFHPLTSLLFQRSGFCSSPSIYPHQQWETKCLESSIARHPRSVLVLLPTFAVVAPPRAKSVTCMRNWAAAAVFGYRNPLME